MSFKVIIAGSRNLSDYELVKNYCSSVLKNKTDIEVVSGSCDCGTVTFVRSDGTKVYGADGLGERFAMEHGYSVKLFPADWKRYGKFAGYSRNRDMGHYAEALIAFWDGISKGTNLMINIARDLKLLVRVKLY